jgi:hypothetical protein
VALPAIQVNAASGLLPVAIFIDGHSQLGVVVMLVVADMRALRRGFMLAIRSYRSPAELDRQQGEQDDGKPTAHEISLAATR